MGIPWGLLELSERSIALSPVAGALGLDGQKFGQDFGQSFGHNFGHNFLHRGLRLISEPQLSSAIPVREYVDPSIYIYIYIYSIRVGVAGKCAAPSFHPDA